MPRAKTKADLILSANAQFDKMWKLIDRMSEEQQEASFAKEMYTAGKETHWSRDKNLRDVLVHLYEWHQLLLSWVRSNVKGESKPFLPKGYNWKTYPLMNLEFWEKHQTTPLIQAKRCLLKSHEEVMLLIDKFSEDELFAKDSFGWTGTSSLGAYCVSTTTSHYDWAIKKIRMHIKMSNSCETQ